LPLAGGARGICIVSLDNLPRLETRRIGWFLKGRLVMMGRPLRSYARGIAVGCLAMMAVTLAAGSLRAAERERLEAFLEVTGFGVALDSIALSASGAPAMLGLSASDFGQSWTDIADEVFDTARMREMGLGILEQAMDDEMLGHAAEFYASDLGQRLVAVENASHLQEDDDAKRAEGEALLAQMEPDRVEVLSEMNAAVDSAGTGVRAVQEIQVRFLLAASYAGVLESEIDEGMLRAVLAERGGVARELACLGSGQCGLYLSGSDNGGSARLCGGVAAADNGAGL